MEASTRASIVHAASGARLAAALLVALAATRLAVVAILDAVHAQGPELPVTRAGSPPSASAPSAAPSSRAARAQRTAAPPGKPAQMNLVVTLGGRAEIYVDRYLVGKSPYIGDISCKVGSPVTIQIVFVKGAPRVAKYTCRDHGTIEIGE